MIIQGGSVLKDFVAEITSTRASVHGINFRVFFLNSIRIRMFVNMEIKIGLVREYFWANLTRIHLLKKKHFNCQLAKKSCAFETTVSGCWPLRWRVSSLIDGKVSLQVGQGNAGVSPVCLARCSIKKRSSLKVIEQKSHLSRGSCPSPDPSPPTTPASCLFSWTLRWVA